MREFEDEREESEPKRSEPKRLGGIDTDEKVENVQKIMRKHFM